MKPVRVLAWPDPADRRQNPYVRLLYGALDALGVQVTGFTPAAVLRGEYDVWHVHWPDSVLTHRSSLEAAAKAAGVVALVAAARVRGRKVVWTVHNVASHGRPHPAIERLFWPAFTRLVDGVLAPSRHGLEAARAAHPALRDMPGFVTPHGHYRGAYPDGMDRAEARRRLDLPADGRVVTFFGSVREDKDVPALVRAFRGLEDPDARLVVAGQPSARQPGVEAELRRTAGDDRRVRRELRWIRDEEVQVFLRAADLVVLPFASILHSGSALLALSFDRPVLAPSRGALPELQEEVGDDWVRTYRGDLEPAVLSDALRWATDRSPTGRPELAGLGWEEVGRQTLHAYRHVLGGAPTTPR